jgi:hypothetical protein
VRACSRPAHDTSTTYEVALRTVGQCVRVTRDVRPVEATSWGIDCTLLALRTHTCAACQWSVASSKCDDRRAFNSNRERQSRAHAGQPAVSAVAYDVSSRRTATSG